MTVIKTNKVFSAGQPIFRFYRKDMKFGVLYCRKMDWMPHPNANIFGIQCINDNDCIVYANPEKWHATKEEAVLAAVNEAREELMKISSQMDELEKQFIQIHNDTYAMSAIDLEIKNGEETDEKETIQTRKEKGI